MLKLSPIAERRILQFKRNRRAYYSLWLFVALFLFSSFAELIANDKPIVVRYNSSFYFPFDKSYPDTAFGGEFETQSDYSDPVVH